MRTLILSFSLFLVFITGCSSQNIEVFAKFNENRPANPAVDRNGNVFVTMHPIDGANISLMKIDKNGNQSIYPNEAWASNPGDDGIGIANAIGIQVTQKDILYILDWGNETSDARIVAWNVAEDKLHRLYTLPSYVQKPNSFLQDFALDTDRQFIYIADMGRGDFTGEQEPAIISVDLTTGFAKRLLNGHETFLAGNEGFKADGEQVTVQTAEGKVPLNLGLNPITIDPNNEWVYYSTVNAGTVYRIKAMLLSDFSKSDKELAQGIEAYGPKPESDGISVDSEGNVYITSLSENAIGITTKDNYDILVQDNNQMIWPDGMSYGPDGYFYVVVDQLHKAAALNGGKEGAQKPYKILKVEAAGKNKIGR
ncbi:MAG: L-dopachrome tautomerase-related protein [Bacteroidota bacterium]